MSCFVLAVRGSAVQQFLHEFCFLHSCQITLIFSHFNLGRFSKPGPPAKRIVYQRSHLSVLLQQGQIFLVALVNKSPGPKSAANSNHNYLLWSTYCRSSFQIFFILLQQPFEVDNSPIDEYLLLLHSSLNPNSPTQCALLCQLFSK